MTDITWDADTFQEQQAERRKAAVSAWPDSNWAQRQASAALLQDEQDDQQRWQKLLAERKRSAEKPAGEQARATDQRAVVTVDEQGYILHVTWWNPGLEKIEDLDFSRSDPRMRLTTLAWKIHNEDGPGVSPKAGRRELEYESRYQLIRAYRINTGGGKYSDHPAIAHENNKHRFIQEAPIAKGWIRLHPKFPKDAIIEHV